MSQPAKLILGISLLVIGPLVVLLSQNLAFVALGAIAAMAGLFLLDCVVMR